MQVDLVASGVTLGFVGTVVSAAALVIRRLGLRAERDTGRA
jgi:hypothetical protein